MASVPDGTVYGLCGDGPRCWDRDGDAFVPPLTSGFVKSSPELTSFHMGLGDRVISVVDATSPPPLGTEVGTVPVAVRLVPRSL